MRSSAALRTNRAIYPGVDASGALSTILFRVAERTRAAARSASVTLLLSALPVSAAEAAKFIPTFLVYYGGGPALVTSDAAKLAKLVMLIALVNGASRRLNLIR